VNKLISCEQEIPQREYLPKGEISRFIESYWESSFGDQVLLAPEGTFNVIYSQKPFVLSCPKTYLLQAGFYLIPINTNLISIYHIDRIVGIRIKAFTIDNITNDKNLFCEKNLHYWRFNKNLSIIKHCEIKWKHNIELFDYISHLEQLSYEILSGHFTLNNTLRGKVNYILDRKGQIKINEMAKDFNISRQSLHKYFIKHLDISPKQLSNIWKINNFIYLANNHKSLTAASFKANYFDQAHCINEFKKYFNCSPKFLLNKKMNFTISCIHNRFNNQYNPR
jgi:AraC-like DNA-binding protein